MVAKQDGLIGDLKDALLQASAEQQVSRHEMNKEVRQHVVDKEEALKAAGEARGALAILLKKKYVDNYQARIEGKDFRERDISIRRT